MSAEASDIAVSELTGVTLDDMCCWVVVAVRHKTVDGKQRHEPVIVPCSRDALPEVVVALERSAASLRTMEPTP